MIFWKNTYSPGIAQWEAERTEQARKLAAVEARAAYLERERQSLRESGLVQDDVPVGRDTSGRFVTPGTPTFAGDPNDIVTRVASGIGGILDVSHRYQTLYGKPLPMNPSELIKGADAAGISPSEYAERQFKFSQREREIHDDQVRQDERARV